MFRHLVADFVYKMRDDKLEVSPIEIHDCFQFKYMVHKIRLLKRMLRFRTIFLAPQVLIYLAADVRNFS